MNDLQVLKQLTLKYKASGSQKIYQTYQKLREETNYKYHDFTHFSEWLKSV